MMAKTMALLLPPAAMLLTAIVTPPIEASWTSAMPHAEARLLAIGLGAAAPILASALIGAVVLWLANGSQVDRAASVGVLVGVLSVILVGFGGPSATAMQVETSRLGLALGISSNLVTAMLALRIAVLGPFARRRATPTRARAKRSVHGEAEWMTLPRLARLFPEGGGIVIGERTRVDRHPMSARPFRSKDRSSWGDGGKAPLITFDCSFGSTHGLVFAGSGGFKTTSVTVPTALSWPSGLVVLDPSREVLPMVRDFRRRLGRSVIALDPASAEIGFNALDWIGQFGSAAEEDIVAVSSWIIPQTGRTESIRDDFFRGAAVQLLTALIADVCLSGHTPPAKRTLRQVRANLAEPEPKLRERLQSIYDGSGSAFVRENVAPFINMTPETFSGVYASAAKETHWLSYENYAALVSGSALLTSELADGQTDVFINLDLQTLETHPGLARVAVGALTKAIFNRQGQVQGRTLFLLDEAARLGYMKILEIARDAGRKYGITLVLMFQSLGQMREAYGGRDATSKWFESASWVSFAAINDLETAEYISRRCGDTTVEVSQVTRSSGGSSRSLSRQLVRRALILPNEVMAMRLDEQIIFSPGSAPIRAGRAIYFRRPEMCRLIRAGVFR